MSSVDDLGGKKILFMQYLGSLLGVCSTEATSLLNFVMIPALLYAWVNTTTI